MSNSILTPTAVTRKALMILHQKLNFVGSVDRQYDKNFANTGAKIGQNLQIRLPNQYSVRTGANLSTQDTTEQSTTLAMATQKGVDTTFTTAELTLSLDDFAERILEPAMSVLAANIEADAMSMYKDVNKQVNNQGSANSFLKVAQAGKLLTDSLTPYDTRRLNMNTQDNLDVVQDLKGLFNAQDKLSSNYREGRLAGPFAGFADIYENTLWPSHTVGDAASYVCNTSTGITSGTATVTVSGGSGTFKQGDIITIAGVYRVHPETKASTGQLQQFVVTADSTTSVAVYPTPVTSGALQNVTIVSAGSGKAVALSGTASTPHGISMAYHKDAFAFVSADLEMPGGVDFSAREVLDGISMRIVRQYVIGSDTIPCRIDVLYGYKAIRPQLACRIANN